MAQEMASFRTDSEGIFSSGGAGAMTRLNKFVDGPGFMMSFDQQLQAMSEYMLPETAKCAALPMVIDRESIYKKILA